MKQVIFVFLSIITYIISSAVVAEADSITAKYYDDFGKKMYAQGMYEEALNMLNNSTNADEDYAEAWFDKGKALCALCREAEANEAWEKARELNHEKAIISTPANCCTDIPKVSDNPSDSRSITWDFEAGNLRGWHAIGGAFEGQPECNFSGLKSLQGKCWISSDDEATGILISLPFRILGDRIDFLIGGCSNCSVSLISNDSVVMISQGNGTDTINKVVWNVSAYKRESAYLRLSDGSASTGGHLNFDDLNFDIPPRLIDSL